jgi:hypothetical protein
VTGNDWRVPAMFKIVKAFQRLELLAPLTAGSRIFSWF